MKHLSEYRDPGLVGSIVEELHALVSGTWTLMEVCGGQTQSLVKNGILEMLPESVKMVHGPGCPVCVTPVSVIDEAVWLAGQEDVILCSFGDMLRVPGSRSSLLEAKARGGDVRMVYSPLEAVRMAGENPDREVVFLAVGFETTAPANALSVIHADRLGMDNYSILASQVRVPPAMEAILADPDNRIDGFLAAGHVCTVMGVEEYAPIVERHKVPVVITGFEPVDLLQGILTTVRQLEKGEARLENQYARYVRREGNRLAQEALEEVFDTSDRMWRGIGNIPASGYEVSGRYAVHNARRRFDIPVGTQSENTGCISGDIMKGLKKPFECPHFGKACMPEHPLGASMVSSEGACAAYYHFYGAPDATALD